MALFGPTRVRCPAGVWTTIVSNAFVQIPRVFDIAIEGPAEGEIEEKKSAWIFPGSPRVIPLAPKIELHRGYFNTFYRVRVRPVADVIAVVE